MSPDEATLIASCFAEVLARRRAAQEATKRRLRKPWGHGVKGYDVTRAAAQAQAARAAAKASGRPRK